ncbi:MAG: glycosyltransferase [Candidatus Eremiobacterota bacterium]
MKLLVGPQNLTFVSHFLRNALREHEVVTFSDQNADVTYDLNRDTFADVLARLPDGFTPDLAVFVYPELQCLVPGLEDCPCPTLLLVSDWHFALDPVVDVCSMFDLVVTDLRGLDVLQGVPGVNAVYRPLYGYDPELHRKLEGCPHELDIGHVGDLNPDLHADRVHFLARAARLGARWRVAYHTGVKGEDYVSLVNRTRITVNHALRQEMSMRCYEAPACGSLLFCEATNREIGRYLQDGVHYVSYDRENFEQRLEYYLENEAERARIADAGHQAIQQFTYRNQMARILELAARLTPGERAFRRLSQPDKHLRRASQAFQAVDPPGLHLALRETEAALKLSPDDPGLWNMLGCLVGTLGDRETDLTLRDPLYARAADAFHRALGAGSVAHLNRAQLLLRQGRRSDGVAALEQAIASDPPFRPIWFYPHVLDAFYWAWHRHPDRRADLVRWKLLELLGCWDPDQAVSASRKAILACPDQPAPYYQLSRFLDRSSPEYVQCLTDCVKLAPLHMNARMALIRAQWTRNRLPAASALIQNTASILAAFPNLPLELERLNGLIDELHEKAPR